MQLTEQYVSHLPPFKTAPFFLLVIGTEKRNQQFRVIVVKLTKINVKIWACELCCQIIVVKNMVFSDCCCQQASHFTNEIPFLARKR